jgi:glycosyltransferase involved in cell wall biosynthesis
MRIAVYKDNLSTGRGADHLICAHAEGLLELGHDVTIVTCPNSREFTFAVADGVKVEFVPRGSIREFVSSFDACVAAGSNEILDLTCGGRVEPPVRTVTELMLAPRGFFKWKHFIRNARIKRAFNLSHALQILCASYEKELRKFAPLPKVATIPEWPDVRKPTADELSGANRRKIIVYPAAINKLKNQMLAIRAFGRLADEFPDWELHIYGKMHKSYGPRCVATVRRMGLEHRIMFMPFTKDLPSVYASASIMAFPSLLEGFPLTIVEGARFALPVVVVEELPGARDMVKDGENGIISRNDVNDYAASLRLLMADESLRSAMGMRARDMCETNYTREGAMSKMDALIHEVTS